MRRLLILSTAKSSSRRVHLHFRGVVTSVAGTLVLLFSFLNASHAFTASRPGRFISKQQTQLFLTSRNARSQHPNRNQKALHVPRVRADRPNTQERFHQLCALEANNNSNNDSNNKSPELLPDPTGLRNGLVILPIVLALCVWMFSIPTEFRRARLCSQEQVVLYPDSKCITFQDWTGGIANYYRNGGGVQFDFSIEDK
jgi:hypothetical protein